eukprot:SAG11_NODE_10990_length_791_cov_0.965318_1_plen_85_part_10
MVVAGTATASAAATSAMATSAVRAAEVVVGAATAADDNLQTSLHDLREGEEEKRTEGEDRKGELGLVGLEHSSANGSGAPTRNG